MVVGYELDAMFSGELVWDTELRLMGRKKQRSLGGRCRLGYR